MAQLGTLVVLALALAHGAAALRAPAGGAGGDAAAAALHVPRGGSPDGPRPWFCHNLDCPEFTVVNATDQYEVRRRSLRPGVCVCVLKASAPPLLNSSLLKIRSSSTCRCATTRRRCGPAPTWRPTPLPWPSIPGSRCRAALPARGARHPSAAAHPPDPPAYTLTPRTCPPTARAAPVWLH